MRSEQPDRVALTGGTGFIGSAVGEALARATVATTCLVRGEPGVPAAGRRWLRGDLTTPSSLPSLVAGADVVVHAASYVGGDPELQEAVNATGTAHLVRAAREAGVRRLVYVSTAGVYGGTLRGGEREDETVVAPGSTLSASRRAAEQVVLAAGGVVVRPHLVFGAGDRWFLGALLPLVQALGAQVGDGQARVSVIDRLTLGRLVAALALGDAAPGVYHAALVDPVRVGDLVALALEAVGATAPTAVLGADEAAQRLAPYGVRPSQLALVTADSWFDSRAVWAATGLVSPAHPVIDGPTAVWYRTLLARP